MFACGQDAGDWLYGKRYRKDFIIQNNAIDAKAYKYNPKIEEEVRKNLILKENL